MENLVFKGLDENRYGVIVAEIDDEIDVYEVEHSALFDGYVASPLPSFPKLILHLAKSMADLLSSIPDFNINDHSHPKY